MSVTGTTAILQAWSPKNGSITRFGTVARSGCVPGEDKINSVEDQNKYSTGGIQMFNPCSRGPSVFSLREAPFPLLDLVQQARQLLRLPLKTSRYTSPLLRWLGAFTWILLNPLSLIKTCPPSALAFKAEEHCEDSGCFLETEPEDAPAISQTWNRVSNIDTSSLPGMIGEQ